jgi:(1->4)-alpha-D-glucan 1-alpha-D-glucosylmutase
VNYRRFFDINDLIGLRMENDEVFHATHDAVLHLLSAGTVTGLRIDHIDGLKDPQAYLDKLPPVYVIVEKILAGKESLPSDWRVWGTTGYDFLNIVNGLFVDRDGYEDLKAIYSDFGGLKATMTDVFRSRKRHVMNTLFAGEVRALVHELAELAEHDRYARDLPHQELREAFVNVTACLPIYRTYVRSCDGLSETDRYQIEDAIAVAGRITPSPAYAFLRQVLLLDAPQYLEEQRCRWLDFIMRWQQFTGPVMAKGLEDTTFYTYNPLVSVNEVGGDSDGPEIYFGVEAFHRRMQERRARWPFTMNAGSTHDTIMFCLNSCMIGHAP